MLDFVLLIFFCVMAYRISTTIYRESRILREFKQPRTLAWAVMLFPLGLLVLMTGMARLPFPLAFVGAAACYLPALFMARKVGHALEKTGTDRVKESQDAVSQAFGTALVGLIYIAVVLVFASAIFTV